MLYINLLLTLTSTLTLTYIFTTNACIANRKKIKNLLNSNISSKGHRGITAKIPPTRRHLDEVGDLVILRTLGIVNPQAKDSLGAPQLNSR